MAESWKRKHYISLSLNVKKQKQIIFKVMFDTIFNILYALSMVITGFEIGF